MRVSGLAVNTFWKLMSHVLSRGSLIVASIILARSLDQIAFAEFSYFQLTAVTVAAYAGMGLGVTASKYFAEAAVIGNARDHQALTLIWLISISVSILFSVGSCWFPVRGFPAVWRFRDGFWHWRSWRSRWKLFPMAHSSDWSAIDLLRCSR